MGQIRPGQMVRWTLLALIIAAISLEGGIRARLALRDPHQWESDGLFRYRPHTQVGLTPDLTTNNQGFFGPDLVMPRDPDVYRLILMGSSSIASSDLPVFVTDALEARYPDRRVEVNSAGLPRYTSHHNRLLFERHILPLEPDAIVLYLGLNNNVYNTSPDYPGEPPLGLWDWRSLRRSIALDMLAYHGIHKRVSVTPDFTAYPGAERFVADVDAIIRQARENDITVILLREALAWPTDDEALARTIRNAEGPMRHFWGELDAALRGAKATDAALDRVAQAHGLPVVDRAQSIPRDSAHFRDLCHFTLAGMQRFGDVVAEAAVP